MAKKKRLPATDHDIEWEGTGENPEDWIRDDGFEALRTNDAALLGQYLREAEVPDKEIVRKLADLLDPAAGAGQRLEFARRRGRPVDKNKIFTEGNIHMLLRFAHRKFGSVEAAVADVAKKTGRSRSGLFAIWGAHQKKLSAKKKGTPTK